MCTRFRGKPLPDIHSSICPICKHVHWRATLPDHLRRKASLLKASGRQGHPDSTVPRHQSGRSYSAQDRYQPSPPGHPSLLRYHRFFIDECGFDLDPSKYLSNAQRYDHHRNFGFLNHFLETKALSPSLDVSRSHLYRCRTCRCGGYPSE